MPHPLPIFSQSDYLIQVVDINSHIEWQTVQIQISWLLQKPTDLDLHCLQRQSTSRFSRTRVKWKGYIPKGSNSSMEIFAYFHWCTDVGLHCLLMPAFSYYRDLQMILQCLALWHYEIFFPENRLWYFRQIVFWEDTVCMKCQSLFSGKIRKNNINLCSAEFVKREWI